MSVLAGALALILVATMRMSVNASSTQDYQIINDFWEMITDDAFLDAIEKCSSVQNSMIQSPDANYNLIHHTLYLQHQHPDNHYMINLCKSLIQKYPNLVKQSVGGVGTYANYSTLHLAVLYQCDLDIIATILKQYPDSYKIKVATSNQHNLLLRALDLCTSMIHTYKQLQADTTMLIKIRNLLLTHEMDQDSFDILLSRHDKNKFQLSVGARILPI